MFARGVVYLYAAHLPVPKSLAAKSTVSISSKLIEIKRLQLLYFGHLRKTGGRGSYRLVHTLPLLDRNSLPLSPIIPTLARPSLNPFPCYIFPATGGWVPLVYPEHERRVLPRLTTNPAASEGGRYTRTERDGRAHPLQETAHGSRGDGPRFSPLVSRHFLPPVGYITTVLPGYCAGPCQNGT